MAISLIQTAGNQDVAVNDITATLGADPTPGNMLILAFKDNDGTSTVTLPDGFNWCPNAPHGPSGRQAGVAYKVAEASDTTAIQVSTTALNTKLIEVWEVSGLTTTGITGTQTATGATATSKTLTSTGALAQANNFVVALADQANSNGGEVSVDESFTLRDTGAFDLWMVADLITSATTELSPTFTWTTSRQSLGFTAVFPEAAAPSGPAWHYRSGGAWVDGTLHVRVGGVWVPATTHYRSGGAWS